MRWIGVVVGSVVVLAVCGLSASADTYTITLDPGARAEPANGRVILFFITEKGPRWDHREPLEGPFFEAPQPIASIEVKNFKPGDSVTIDSKSNDVVQSEPLAKLAGKVRVQAILDADQTERSFLEGAGNVFSEELAVELSADKDDQVALKLTKKVEPAKRAELPNLKWVNFRSELLSKFYGRDVFHRAGVALPAHYEDPNWPRQQWPAIYVVPGFGDREEGAEEYALMLSTQGIEEIAPIAVYVVLDPESPLGHHGFADSENNGPRDTALVTEFIPYLESQFRLAAKPEARLVTGHSSGGWSSLWLQLNHQDVFGGCWCRAPDPVDFQAFQMTNLYSDMNLYQNEQGEETPSYRELVSLGKSAPKMSVRQECAMEAAIDPNGRSGQQWDAWEAAFSRKDAETGMPTRMFDRKSGTLNKPAIRNWGRYDISQQVVIRWPKLGPVFLDRVRLAVGEDDSFFLNRAVELLAKMIQEQKERYPETLPQNPKGYILVVPGADHSTIEGKTFQRWNQEMRAHLQANGLHDPDPPAAPAKK
jgi:hypothetical protein